MKFRWNFAYFAWQIRVIPAKIGIHDGHNWIDFIKTCADFRNYTDGDNFVQIITLLHGEVLRLARSTFHQSEFFWVAWVPQLTEHSFEPWLFILRINKPCKCIIVKHSMHNVPPTAMYSWLNSYYRSPGWGVCTFAQIVFSTFIPIVWTFILYILCYLDNLQKKYQSEYIVRNINSTIPES